MGGSQDNREMGGSQDNREMGGSPDNREMGGCRTATRWAGYVWKACRTTMRWAGYVWKARMPINVQKENENKQEKRRDKGRDAGQHYEGIERRKKERKERKEEAIDLGYALVGSRENLDTNSQICSEAGKLPTVKSHAP